MQTTTRSTFPTITTEGAILPADLLQRIADGRDLDGLRPEDYHLGARERLNEAISRSWNRLLGVWAGFAEGREALAAGDPGTTLTRERWLLILFQELGYGRLPFRGSLSIDGQSADDDEGQRYPISHDYEGIPIHLVSFRQPLDRADGGHTQRRRSPHSLLQEFLNRSSDALWGFASNGLVLRVLRDNASLTRPAYLEFDLEAMMTGELFADFSLLWLVAHQSRVERQVIERPKAMKKAGKKAAGEEDEDGDEEAVDTPARKPTVADCWLERWSRESAEQGTRALDSLRDGVQEAITVLGGGFLAHPGNGQLRAALQSGALTKEDYYRRLLRLVYRMIFLFVAEDRELLLLPDTLVATRERYIAYYSAARLRALAERRRSGPHPDLYRGLRLIFEKLRDGYPALGLPALGGFLFSGRATPDLDAAEIANEALLAAVRALAFTVEGRVLRPVDYRSLGAEELGSVYESLLELHPELNVAAATFALRSAAGSERKTTGSYYTPTSLITSLLDSALEPVVADRLKGKKGAEAEAALLDIKVVDPAAGSGHFLIAAANRLAGHLARVRTGDSEPSPADRRDALRDVVGRCLYGVDLNEMAVELCKVGLWLETLDPGRPLSFLDHHIRHGNSLIGATPALLREGIPDAAFTPITGDDKAYVSEWKKRNKKEREGQMGLALDAAPWLRLGDLAAAVAALEATPDETIAGVRAREAAWERLVRSGEYENNRLLADAWCAAFVFPKHYGVDFPISENDLRDIERNPHSLPRWMKEEIARLREQYRFFHWHLAFPEVFRPARQTSEDSESSEVSTGWTGGFDVVLGNPPWERIKLQEKEWFAGRDEAIAGAPNAAARGRLIAALPKENPALHEAFQADRRAAEGESHIIRNSGRYPLCGRGDVNTYTIFAELSRHLTGETGRAGIIVPSGIATDDTTKFYFQDIVETGSLVSLYDFENREKIFPAVDSRMKFCLLTLRGSKGEGEKGSRGAAEFVFFALNTDDLKDEARRFTLTAEEIGLLNPNTRTCPIFRGKRDAELTKAIYRRVPVLIREGVGSGEEGIGNRERGIGNGEGNPWGIKFSTMFHMSNDSHLFRTRAELEAAGWRLVGNRFVRDTRYEIRDTSGETSELVTRNSELVTYLPLYEAKMLHHFDHRWATYENDTDTRDVTAAERDDPAFVVRPRYWVDAREVENRLGIYGRQWLVALRDITNTTNERTSIFLIVPMAGFGHTAPLIFIGDHSPDECGLLITQISSFVYDYVTRQKVGGTHMSYGLIKQLPSIASETYTQPCPWTDHASRLTLHAWLLPRILELTYTAYDLRPFALDCGYYGPPFRWDEERRFLIRCELDAAYFHLYGIERDDVGDDDVAYIMDTFPIVRRKDEAAHGEYRTKRVILEMYDELRDTKYEIRDTKEGGYRTRLEPPPGDPRAAHAWDEAWLGAELPVGEWWQPITNYELRITNEEGVASDELRLTSEEGRTGSATKAAGGFELVARHSELVTGPPLELRPPPGKKGRKGAGEKGSGGAGKAHSSQLPISYSPFPAPTGPRNVRLRRAMELGEDPAAAATAELVAFLADADSSIRWLAGSTLGRRPDAAGVVAAIAAFLRGAEAERVAVAREEMARVLEMVGDGVGEEGARAAAERVLREMGE